MKRIDIVTAAALVLFATALLTGSAHAQNTLLDDFEGGALDGHWLETASGEQWPNSPYTVGEVVAAPAGLPAAGSFSMRFWQLDIYVDDWTAAPADGKPWWGQLRWYASGPGGTEYIDLTGLTGISMDIYWDLANVTDPDFQVLLGDSAGHNIYHPNYGNGQIDDLLWSPVLEEVIPGSGADGFVPGTWTSDPTTEENFLWGQVEYIALELYPGGNGEFFMTGEDQACIVDNFTITGITTTIPEVPDPESVGDWSMY